jgi:hypothetical protein
LKGSKGVDLTRLARPWSIAQNLRSTNAVARSRIIDQCRQRDELIVEFRRVVDAVRCAIEIQRAMDTLPGGAASARSATASRGFWWSRRLSNARGIAFESPFCALSVAGDLDDGIAHIFVVDSELMILEVEETENKSNRRMA